MILKGYKFGMILQLAIGPMCLFIFQTSMSHGFIYGELGVIGTAIIDTSEIILAIVGIGTLLDYHPRAQSVLKIYGIVILVLYGIISILSSLGIDLLPSLALNTKFNSSNILIQAILLALSDPLTIVFWAGIFASRIAEDHMTNHDLYHFAFGCILATLSFLSFISLLGTLTHQVIPDTIINTLNIIVGISMFYFAYRNIKKA